MARVLEIRVGMPVSPDETRSIKPCWPATEANDSSFKKYVVGPTVNVHVMGIEGNAAGYPGHIADTLNRSILVHNESNYPKLRTLFPAAEASLVRGGFGENLVVDHPSLMHDVVCIGDKYQIGSVIVMISGPRAPCPKVDGWHAVKGLTQYCRENGASGYFLRVLQEGTFSVGDEIVLLERPRPGYTIERISQGLWGPADVKDETVEFLTAVASMEELIGRHYRETAATKLQRVLDKAT